MAKPEHSGRAVPHFFISSGNCKVSGAHAQPDSTAGNHRGLGETPTKRFQELAGRAENGNRAFVYTNALLRQFVYDDSNALKLL
jgi:hypothetical protein